MLSLTTYCSTRGRSPEQYSANAASPVVVVFTLKTVPVSVQYLLMSVQVQLTQTPCVVTSLQYPIPWDHEDADGNTYRNRGTANPAFRVVRYFVKGLLLFCHPILRMLANPKLVVSLAMGPSRALGSHASNRDGHDQTFHFGFLPTLRSVHHTIVPFLAELGAARQHFQVCAGLG